MSTKIDKNRLTKNDIGILSDFIDDQDIGPSEFLEVLLQQPLKSSLKTAIYKSIPFLGQTDIQKLINTKLKVRN